MSGVANPTWFCLRQLLQRRWFVATVTGIAAVASVVISLLLPNWYLAETRLLLPGRTSSGLLSSVLGGQLSTTASSLLGGLVSDYQRQLAILDSRSLKEQIVGRFDLIEVYDLADSDTPMVDAIEELESNLRVEVESEFNYLAIQVYDKDPQRAADMANFFVDELNRITIELASQTAGAFRRQVERRYQAIDDSLAAVLEATRQLQERTGVLDLPAQGTAFLEGLTEWRMEILMAELDLDRLTYLYGEDHSQTRAARQSIASAQASFQEALEGEERLLPVAQDSLPDVAMQFAHLQKEALILTTLVEFARPILEEARMEEEREAQAVQVMDAAIVPTEKARPWRAAICVVTTLSGFMIAVLYVIATGWWRENHARIAEHLAPVPAQ